MGSTSLRLLESGLPVERIFLSQAAESVGGNPATGRTPRSHSIWDHNHKAAQRLTTAGRNFVQTFAKLSGGSVIELQIVARTSRTPAFISLSQYCRIADRSTYVLFGPGDQGGLLTHGYGSLIMRAGDLWHAEKGVRNVQVETVRHTADLLLMRIEDNLV